jgi:hypothetical protein
MKVIINEEQLRLIIESEGGENLFYIPAHFLVNNPNVILDKYKKKRDYDGLRVGGNLNLENLPSDVVQKILNELIEVDGYLYIRRRDIESLGKLKRVKGSLGVTGCRKLESFGNLESVGGDLNIGLTPLAKLSDEKIKNQIEIKGEIYR